MSGRCRRRRARIWVRSSLSAVVAVSGGPVMACIEVLLFVAKGVDRSERRRPVCGIDAEEEADADADAEGEGDRRPGEYRLDADDLEMAADDPGDDAGHAADDREEDGLGEELAEDVTLLRADCL